MARTHGRGNPAWSRDEIILALELYNKFDSLIPSNNDEQVRALSQYLRSLPYHGNKPRNETFRNPDGVVFKLNNIRAVATGKGLKNVSAMDRAVWKDLGGNPRKVKTLAKQIRESVTITESTPENDDDDADEVFKEGQFTTRMHKTRERSRRIRKRLLKSKRKSGPLSCDLCGAQSPTADTRYEDAMFEGHHIVPIAQSFTRETRLKDMALLCANCHRLIHRVISKEKKWLGVAEVRAHLKTLGRK